MNVKFLLSYGFQEFFKEIGLGKIVSNYRHDFSVIIPVFNGASFLSVLRKSIGSPKYHIVLVDDCSNDNTENFLKKNKISYIRNKKNLGYEKSLLKGINYIIKKFKKKKLFVQ
jgi:glycosyltransferase involved in cell wall biosynthesis